MYQIAMQNYNGEGNQTATYEDKDALEEPDKIV